MASNELELAGLPPKPELTAAQEVVLEQLAAGRGPAEIAKRIHPKDPAKRRRLRQRLWRLIRKDPLVQRAIVERAQGESLVGLIPATQALAQRASYYGKSPEVKFLYESLGLLVHKSAHEHSGEVKLVIEGMPRPAAVVDDEPVDAEVVD